jgi:hypothetical protein
MFPECLEKMVALAERYPNVAIVGAYGISERTLYGNVAGTKIHWVGLPYPSSVVPGHEMCRARLLGGPYLFGSPTATLLRSDEVRRRTVFYNEANIHADSEACFEILEDRDFGFVHQVLTYQGTQDDSLTAMSQKLQTYLPMMLHELVKYGPKYLEPGELKHRLRAHLGEYYAYLGEQAYKRRGREFWRLHRTKLSSAGYPLSRKRLVVAALAYAADAGLNPKSTVERIVGRIRARFSRNAEGPR